jgi:ATP-dependent protease ClpP protease subunit
MKINVTGPIISDGEKFIYDWYGVPATCPNDINKALNRAELNEEIEVKINSGGGSVFSGSEIYTNLKDYDGNVKIKIVGIAASAASVIAMAGDKILMSPTAQLMIHNAACGDEGDHISKRKTADVLEGISKSIANAYEIKTGMKHEDLMSLMSEETWMTAQQAIEKKFADEVMFSEEKFLNSEEPNKDGTLPKVVIDKMRNQLKNDPNFTNSVSIQIATDNKIKELELAKAKLIAKYK